MTTEKFDALKTLAIVAWFEQTGNAIVTAQMVSEFHWRISLNGSILGYVDINIKVTKAPQPTPMPEWLERQLQNVELTVADWSTWKREAAGLQP